MSEPVFLTRAELVELTGWKVAPRQIAWLRAHGIPHTINAKDKPVVRRDYNQPTSPNDFELGEVS